MHSRTAWGTKFYCIETFLRLRLFLSVLSHLSSFFHLSVQIYLFAPNYSMHSNRPLYLLYSIINFWTVKVENIIHPKNNFTNEMKRNKTAKYLTLSRHKCSIELNATAEIKTDNLRWANNLAKQFHSIAHSTHPPGYSFLHVNNYALAILYVPTRVNVHCACIHLPSSLFLGGRFNWINYVTLQYACLIHNTHTQHAHEI